MKYLKNLCNLLLILSLLGMNCCKKQVPVWESEDKVKIVATTTMVADLVRQIGGDHVEVYGLMNDTVNPHDYESRPVDVNATKSADLVIYSGIHLEAQLAEMLEKMEKALAVTSTMKKESLIASEDEQSSYADPHVWGDPMLWVEAVQPVVDALSKVDASNAAAYKSAGEAYVEKLKAHHQWAQSRINEIPAEHKVLVTSHDAFMYFSRAYGIEVKAIDGLAPGDKGGPKKVAALIEFIKARDLKMIFPEHAVNQKGIQAIAKDAGVKVSDKMLFSDATGVLGEKETVNGETYDLGTYLGMQKHNVNAVVEGLK